MNVLPYFFVVLVLQKAFVEAMCNATFNPVKPVAGCNEVCGIVYH
jgi:hypothetical protein